MSTNRTKFLMHESYTVSPTLRSIAYHAARFPGLNRLSAKSYSLLAKVILQRLSQYSNIREASIRTSSLNHCEPGLSDLDFVVHVDPPFQTVENLLPLRSTYRKLKKALCAPGEIVVCDKEIVRHAPSSGVALYQLCFQDRSLRERGKWLRTLTPFAPVQEASLFGLLYRNYFSFFLEFRKFLKKRSPLFSMAASRNLQKIFRVTKTFCEPNTNSLGLAIATLNEIATIAMKSRSHLNPLLTEMPSTEPTSMNCWQLLNTHWCQRWNLDSSLPKIKSSRIPNAVVTVSTPANHEYQAIGKTLTELPARLRLYKTVVPLVLTPNMEAMLLRDWHGWSGSVFQYTRFAERPFASEHLSQVHQSLLERTLCHYITLPGEFIYAPITVIQANMRNFCSQIQTVINNAPQPLRTRARGITHQANCFIELTEGDCSERKLISHALHLLSETRKRVPLNYLVTAFNQQ